MSKDVELKSYSSFSTISYELRELKEQVQMMQDSIEGLHNKVQAREGTDSTCFANLQNQDASISQDNRGFAVQNDRSVEGSCVVDISLGEMDYIFSLLIFSTKNSLKD